MRVYRLVADNPGPFTGPGTNTYVVEDEGQVLLIDPGPDEPANVYLAHRAAIESVVEGKHLLAVLVTHSHPDHAPAANPIAASLSVPAYGFDSGPGFEPDVRLSDGSHVDVGGSSLLAIHTPGHTPDHLCYRLGDSLFTGDHIMGGSTVIIEDLAAYLDSLAKLRDTGLSLLYPGHGPQLASPDAVITEYLEHRREREQQILAAVKAGARTVETIVANVYVDLAPDLHRAAAYQVTTHLRKLADEGRVRFAPGKTGAGYVELVEEAT